MKRFIVQSYRRKYSFETLEEAKAYAQKVFQKSGVIVGIEETPQPAPTRNPIPSHPMKTKVVFRKGPASHGGEILAIFPEIAATHTGADCLSYAHTGQHGACCPFIHRRGYRLATPEEYAPLKRELESIGYSLHVVNVISPAMTRARLSSVTR